MREDTLLQYVYARNETLTSGVTIPPGDDMGAVAVGSRQVLITVDQVADGVHVDLATTSLDKVGRKAITRNLSDVAAMAAVPIGAVAAVSLPRNFGQDRAQQLFEAMRQTAATYHCPLMGGDISMWDHPLVISVTVLAEPAGVEPVLRRGAKAGDGIYVTGTLGGSLETLGQYTHHLDFTPRIDVARALAEQSATRPHCMIDLSDGLARDLRHLCDAAELSAVIDVQRLPVSEAARQRSQRTGNPAWQHAVGDGEDYELLFTAPLGAIPSELGGVPITCIGSMGLCDDHGPVVSIRLQNGQVIRSTELGWEHHA